MDNATTSDSTTQYIRLNLEIVLEVTDADALRAAALETVKADEELSAGDRTDAIAAIEADLAESVSYLIDPFGLVEDIAGTELSEAGWQSEGAEQPEGEDEEDDEDA
ncbi:hypothetical protein [Streptomyces sp. SID3343]|uniref:hypothetical protein n=1 Tax=Streptomyces sp. SID3343 TaxID=2690260 RepID=UPI001370501C|nr:hypothetical protein [Streptomyces sp. SID3343]MYV97514.1 hypothetical protein [Streptomyces sp. SID3343]